ncbi:MAG: hypothetical protein PHC97_00060 [Patescibacteria group bacterium]|nr:hypothetical protein [Patescibacteria group bacterium]
MYRDGGKLEKIFPHGQEAKDFVFELFADNSPFLKRFCIPRTSGNQVYESREEAELAREKGEIIQPASLSPSIRESLSQEELEFYYADEEIPKEVPIKEKVITNLNV